jgi:HAE1 family hydrophobic/amphiphilic exporter-1
MAGRYVEDWVAPSGKSYPLLVRSKAADRSELDTMSQVDLMALAGSSDSSGVPMRLATVSHLESSRRASAISRENGHRILGLQADLRSGRALGELAPAIRAAVTALPMPAGYAFRFGGALEEAEGSKQQVAIGIASGLGLAALVSWIAFGSFGLALLVITAIPLGAMGAWLTLWLSGSTLNVFSAVGVIFLCALVAKNGVLLVDEAVRQERAGRSPLHAAARAALVRLRPILMTTAAMVFATLPIALGYGEGGEQLAPMGRAILGGLLMSTLLSLLLLPAMYSLLPLRPAAQAN